MKFSASRLLVLAASLAAAAYLQAHHNTQSEFGAFGSETIYFEGRIVNIKWGNPHIFWDVEVTGGDLGVGEKWRIVSHPVNIQQQYGFNQEDFAVGDSVKAHAWKQIRGQPLVWARAIQVNDGPMRSNLRFTDMIDIANGVFEEKNIQPPANLNGSPPARAGEETVSKLQEMGLLDEDGLMIWPPPR